MHITVLTVPGCPSAPVVMHRITQALGERSADIDRIEIAGQDEAERWGMTGSPTVLINGADPFTVAGTPASVSCRIYRGPDGTTDVAPSVADLRWALDAAEAATDAAGPPLDAASRGG
jgi:hypothetical protein